MTAPIELRGAADPIGLAALAAQYGWPLARGDDPVTSHEAAAAVKPGREAIQKAIRTVLRWKTPLTAEEIAAQVLALSSNRWLHSTIVTACNPKRSGLVVVGYATNSRGRRVQLLGLPND